MSPKARDMGHPDFCGRSGVLWGGVRGDGTEAADAAVGAYDEGE